MALADYQQLVADIMADQEADVLTGPVRDRAIEQALLRYSADCLRTVIVDVTWPATGVFGTVPAGWDASAWVKSAEYPVGQSPRRMVHMQAYRTPDGWGLESMQALPTGAQVRLTYSTAHVVTADEDTVPLVHRLPVAQYAAYLLCHQLATRYSAERETAIGADVSLTETRARAYAARAKEHRSAYYVGIGLADPFSAQGAAANNLPGAAAGVVSWPSNNPRHRLVQRGGV